MVQSFGIAVLSLLFCCASTAGAQQLDYMSFDRWSKTGGTWYPFPENAEESRRTWDSANKGLSLLGVNTTTPEYGHVAVAGKGKPFPETMAGGKVQFSQIDIRDEAAITDHIANGKYDCIVHLAAISRVVDGEKDKPNCIQTNYVGTRSIIDAVAKYSPSTHVIFASSREVYGEQKNLPVSEDAELLPINVYGFYKLLAEQYIRATISNYTILRLCNVYGSAYDLPGRVIPNFVRRAITGETMTIEGGSQMIDFTYIKDTVWAFCQCIELIPAGPVNKETITISPGEGHTLQEIVEILSSELGRNLNVCITPERNYDVQRFVGNRARREKLLGDRRFLSLPEGIRQTLTLYKNQ